VITFEHYKRYEICPMKLGSLIDTAYGTIKWESFNFAQEQSNKHSLRFCVYDTHRGAKFYWEFIPASEGAQGMIAHSLK